MMTQPLLTIVTALLISVSHAGHLPITFEGTDFPLRAAAPGTFRPIAPEATDFPIAYVSDSFDNITILDDGRVVFDPAMRAGM